MPRRLAAVALLVAVIGALPWASGATPEPASAPTVAWTVDRPGDGASARGVIALDGADLAVVFDTRVDRYDADGTLVWSAVDLPRFGNTIAAADVTGDGADDVLVASAAISDPPAHLTALDGTDGSVIWSVETGGAQVNDIAVAGEGPDATVVIAAMPTLADGRIEGYAAGSGEPLWAEEASVVTAITATTLTTVAGTQHGALVIVDTTTGTRIADLALGIGLVRDLVPVDGTLAGVTLVAVGDEGVSGVAGLAATDLLHAPLADVWTYRADARFWSGVSAQSDNLLDAPAVYINARSGDQVHAIDSQTGDVLWTAGTPAARGSLPYLSPRSVTFADLGGDGTPEVIAAGAGNTTRAFDAATGTVLWDSPTPGPVDWLAVVGSEAGPRIALAHPYWFVGAIDAHGSLAWSHDYSVHQAGTPHDMDGDGHDDVVASTAGHVYVIDGATAAQTLRVATWPLLADAVTTNVAVADLTGDDVPDVIASARTGSIRGVVAAFDGTNGDTLWTSYADYIIGGFTGDLLVHDLDGDGVPDVTFASNKGFPSHVIAVSGVDGTTLWRHHVGDDLLDLALATTPSGVVVVFLRDHTSCGCFVHPDLVALDGDGVVAWNRTIRDHGAVDIAIARDTTTGTDLIVVRDNDDPPDGDVPLAGDGPRFAHIDATTGTEVRRVLLEPLLDADLDAGPFHITGDVNGDGVDDTVFTLRDARGRDALAQVVVLSGVDDSVLWKSPFRAGTANVLAMGPIKDSGASDVLAAWAGGTIARLGGLDGTLHWEHESLGGPTWFLGAGKTSAGGNVVFAPQGTVIQALLDP